MKRPSLLFINRVYPPVAGATGQLLAQLAPALVGAGWNVTVLTAAPGDIAPVSESVDGVQVERVRGIRYCRATHWRRALSYLSLYPVLLWRAWRLPRADVVVTLTDPPLQLILGPILGFLKRARVVHWAQDIYPEIAEEMGMLARGGIVARVLRALSSWALNRGDAVIAVGRCMKERILGRGVAPEVVQVIPNWGHGTPAAHRTDCGEAFRREHGMTNRFVIMYSGNLGMAHPFEEIIDAAQQMETTAPNALFVFVGDGPRRAWVEQQVVERRLANVRFLPFQPRQMLTESLGAANIHIASMEENLLGLVVPSKVYGVLGAGRPCILLGPTRSEASKVILEHRYGEVLSHPSGSTLAKCLQGWMQSPHRLADIRERAPLVAAGVGFETAAAAFDGLFRRTLKLEASGREKKPEAPGLDPLPDHGGKPSCSPHR